MATRELTAKEKELEIIYSRAIDNRPDTFLFRTEEFTREEFPEVYTEMMAVSRTAQAYTRTALLFVGFAIAISDFVIDKTFDDYRAHFFQMMYAVIGFIMFFYGFIRNSGMQMGVLRNRLPMDLFGPWMIFILGNISCVVALIVVLAPAK